MAQLVFEIWEDPDSGSQGMYQADPRSDETRRRIEPNAVLIHSFKARSSFEAFRMLYAWNDWGEWQPPPGIEDNIFTDEEEAAQRRISAHARLVRPALDHRLRGRLHGSAPS